MRWPFFLVTMCLFISCKNKNDDIISPPLMTTILWDMIQVDEFASANLLKDTTKNIKIERIKLYQQVFKLHKISEKKFSTSFAYYTGHPDVMKVMFDSLSARGERERNIMYLPKNLAPK